MPKIPMSTMTISTLVPAIWDSGLSHAEFAEKLGISQSRLSQLVNGRTRIPQSIAARVTALVNTMPKRPRHVRARTNNNLNKLMGRKREPNASTYPPYRMSIKRYETYLRSLAGWQAGVQELAKYNTDAQSQQDYQIEMENLRALFASAPRGLPYDVVIDRHQWRTVSTALRRFGDAAPTYRKRANSLYVHWRKFRGTGFPPNRSN